MAQLEGCATTHAPTRKTTHLVCKGICVFFILNPYLFFFYTEDNTPCLVFWWSRRGSWVIFSFLEDWSLPSLNLKLSLPFPLCLSPWYLDSMVDLGFDLELDLCLLLACLVLEFLSTPMSVVTLKIYPSSLKSWGKFSSFPYSIVVGWITDLGLRLWVWLLFFFLFMDDGTWEEFMHYLVSLQFCGIDEASSFLFFGLL